jgi:hypothetical protein
MVQFGSSEFSKDWYSEIHTLLKGINKILTHFLHSSSRLKKKKMVWEMFTIIY